MDLKYLQKVMDGFQIVLQEHIDGAVDWVQWGFQIYIEDERIVLRISYEDALIYYTLERMIGEKEESKEQLSSLGIPFECWHSVVEGEGEYGLNLFTAFPIKEKP